MRVFCSVHGSIELGACAAAASSTDAFLRLDGVRQLGGCSHVYPSATHTRREHSIGVAHLAATVGRALMARYPDAVSPRDVARLELAGLLHDLGHGPFSHIFEACFPSYSHEAAGVELITRGVAGAHPELSRDGNAVLGEGWVEDVVRMVLGEEPAGPRRFLYQIVHATATGIDVDRLDYLLRDSHSVFGRYNALAVDRIIDGMRLAQDDDGNLVIAFDERVTDDVCEVYRLRSLMHARVYQHRSTLLVETLLIELIQRVERARVAQGQPPLIHAVEKMTDASITLHPAADIQRVAEWKRWHRVDWTVALPVHPACGSCGHTTTRFDDAFCTRCGAPFGARAAVACDANASVFQPPSAAITAADATSTVATASGVDVRVCISDIQCGARCITVDRSGTPWLDFTWGLVPVVQSDGGLHRGDARLAQSAPQSMRIRKATCFVAPHARTAEVAAAEAAFLAWGRKHGLPSQLL